MRDLGIFSACRGFLRILKFGDGRNLKSGENWKCSLHTFDHVFDGFSALLSTVRNEAVEGRTRDTRFCTQADLPAVGLQGNMSSRNQTHGRQDFIKRMIRVGHRHYAAFVTMIYDKNGHHMADSRETFAASSQLRMHARLHSRGTQNSTAETVCRQYQLVDSGRACQGTEGTAMRSWFRTCAGKERKETSLWLLCGSTFKLRVHKSNSVFVFWYCMTTRSILRSHFARRLPRASVGTPEGNSWA